MSIGRVFIYIETDILFMSIGRVLKKRRNQLQKKTTYQLEKWRHIKCKKEKSAAKKTTSAYRNIGIRKLEVKSSQDFLSLIPITFRWAGSDRGWAPQLRGRDGSQTRRLNCSPSWSSRSWETGCYRWSTKTGVCIQGTQHTL